MDNRVYVISDSRLQEKSKQEVTEEFSKKLFSTFERVFDELCSNSNGKNVIYVPDSELIKTFNFNLKKNVLSKDNIEYIFTHGKNIIKLCSKFPLNGTIIIDKLKYFLTDLQDNNKAVDYLDLVKKYLDYYVLDRDYTDILKDGKLIKDLISKQDIENREVNGYSYLLRRGN